MRYPHRESPARRVRPSGKVVWEARVTTPDGRRTVYGPEWNGGKGAFERKRRAQDAIDEYYERTYGRGVRSIDRTVGEYSRTWTKRHPRAERTNETNESRLRQVLDVELEGRRLRDWALVDLRRRHTVDLVEHMLSVQGRSRNGAVNILRSLSAMVEDAITDQDCDVNWVKGVRVRKTDTRIQKPDKPPRVYSFEQMREFCRLLGRYELLGRTFCDLGLRVSEALPLERGDLERTEGGWVVCVRRTIDKKGHISELTKREKLTGEETGGRVTPAPPSLIAALERTPARIDTPVLFSTPSGKVFSVRNFYRDVWHPAQEQFGAAELARRGYAVEVLERRELRELMEQHRLNPRPHDFRHSWESHLHAAGIDQADLADMAGHTVQTMKGHYVHALRRSYARAREVIG